MIGLVVDPSGNPVDVHIVRPVGMGMDEAAVTAVSQYRFALATKNGKAVPAAISVEVSFELPGKSGR
ncbi:MAG: energy transducer TonB [Acidobacteriaceae bacterium]